MDMFASYKSSSPRKPRAVLQIVHIELASIEPSEAARKKNTNCEDDDRPVPGPLRPYAMAGPIGGPGMPWHT